MRDLQEELRRHLASELHGSHLGPWIHDIVYGAHDGIVTTFAVVAGTVGAGLPVGIVVIIGMANLLADGVSMGAGAFLSLRSERDQYERLLKEELQEIDDDPEIEREEIREAYRAKGFSGEDLERTVAIITRDKTVWAETMMREEHGMMPPGSSDNALLHGVATFLGFFVFGGVPLLPYLMLRAESNNFVLSIAGAAFALLLVGITRSLVTRERIYRGAIEILLIGATTASVAYGVGVALKSFAGV
ncbi:VIT1/CCC1 transporter family protein [Candidatus Peregrinibacteria bacterium]|nr:VIT1/CCC1 transporter family protein [Candidatus Peregrinibacteria bacterium]